MTTVAPRSNASLRTKTGCLTCRARRKKCDEQRPLCAACAKSDRVCEWPATEDLIDGRHKAQQRRERSESFQSAPDSRQIALVRRASSDQAATGRKITAEAAVSSAVLGDCLEIVVGRHFIDTYYSTLINPETHRDFFDDWLNDIQTFMTQSPGLRYSVLANAASNLYLSGEPGQMQELALSYYSRSLRGLTQAVAGHVVKDSNAVLMSVMLLYLHGCMGHGTYPDVPLHVDAAIRIITWRFLESDPPAGIKRPFDRLAVESVIYQIYLLRMGLWSERNGDGLDFNFDPLFWLKCEALLARSIMYPDHSNSSNSPVLGMPFVLFKIMLMIRTLWEEDRTTRSFRRSLARLKDELQPWEDWLTGSMHGDAAALAIAPDDASESMTKDATLLMTLGALLLVEQLGNVEYPTRPVPISADAWKIDMVASIISSRRQDQRWATCCLANYPLYVVGFFMRSPVEIDLVRHEMRQRSEKMAWSQVHRFWDDLEATWRDRC